MVSSSIVTTTLEAVDETQSSHEADHRKARSSTGLSMLLMASAWRFSIVISTSSPTQPIKLGKLNDGGL